MNKPNIPDTPNAITMESLLKREKLPNRICIYGDGGLGKTTFAARANKPIFVITEDGLGDINVPSFPLANTFAAFASHIEWVLENEHDFETLVIDSLDWLETLIWQHVCDRDEKKDITDFGYGEGYVKALRLWNKLFEKLNQIREKRKMQIILICHAQTVKVENPLLASFDKHDLKLHKKAAAKVEEFCDFILYAAWQVSVTKQKEGFGERSRAVSTGDRILYTQGSPSYTAKSRAMNLPPQIALDYQEFSNALTNNKGE